MIWIPLLLVLEAIFSAAEMAFIKADRIRLRAESLKGLKRAKIAYIMYLHPDRYLTVTLVVTNTCMIAIASLCTIHLPSEWMAIAVASSLIVIFGELIPKAAVQKHATQYALFMAPIVSILGKVLYPITKTLTIYTNFIKKLLRPLQDLLGGKTLSPRDELLQLLHSTGEEVDIRESEKEILRRVFDFRNTLAKHIQIPLIRVEAISSQASIREAMERFASHRHSRMPVFSGRVDNMVGILEIGDLFDTSDFDQKVQTRMQPPRFISESQSLESILRDMRQDGLQICFVVDEYGGASGILTFEDIVEEILGEIADEHDERQELLTALDAQRYVVQARIEIGHLNEKAQLDLPEGDYETLGGFLLQQFGRIPSFGDDLMFETPLYSLRFTIRKATERQIQTVLVEIFATKALQEPSNN